MQRLVYLDGKLVPPEQAHLSVYDHGLLYGDGIYEGVRAYNGSVFQLDEHLDRLARSAKFMRLSLPDKEELIQAVLRTLWANELREAYIRIVVTRGAGKLGPNPKTCPQPTLVIIAEPTPPVFGDQAGVQGLSAAIVSSRRDPIDATTHQVKSLNYLNSVLATVEAEVAHADAAIMLDSRGFVCESAICNIFTVRGMDLSTPTEGSGILRGITRDVVIDLAPQSGLNVRERDITPFELLTADEVFLTGTHAEIVAITSINGVAVGDGAVGPNCTQLMTMFRKATMDPQRGTPIGQPSTAEAV